MNLNDLLSADATLCGLRASSKKHALHELAQKAEDVTGAPARTILDAVLEREKLGSTGVGAGVAIPHAHLEAVGRVTGVFARLATPLDFDAIDDQPVDLVFLLLAPPDAGAAHLKALARVSRTLRRKEARARLRTAPTADAIYAI